jgi:hypothetical protein
MSSAILISLEFVVRFFSHFIQRVILDTRRAQRFDTPIMHQTYILTVLSIMYAKLNGRLIENQWSFLETFTFPSPICDLIDSLGGFILEGDSYSVTQCDHYSIFDCLMANTHDYQVNGIWLGFSRSYKFSQQLISDMRIVFNDVEERTVNGHEVIYSENCSKYLSSIRFGTIPIAWVDEIQLLHNSGMKGWIKSIIDRTTTGRPQQLITVERDPWAPTDVNQLLSVGKVLIPNYLTSGVATRGKVGLDPILRLLTSANLHACSTCENIWRSKFQPAVVIKCEPLALIYGIPFFKTDVDLPIVGQ